MESFVDDIEQLLAAGEVDKARALVESHAATYPVRYELGMAVLAANRRDGDAALEHAGKAHLLVPNDPIVLQQLAVAHHLRGDLAAAEQWARAAADRDGSLRSLGGLANVLWNAGKVGDAEVVFRKMLEKDPTNLQALNGLGTTLYKQRDHAGALKSYAKAFDTDPADFTPIKSLMNMYAEAGRVLGALAAAGLARDQPHADEESVALDMTMLHLTRVLISEFPAHQTVGEIDEQVTALVASVTRRPARVKLAAARTLYDCARYDEARWLLEASERQDMTDADTGNAEYLKGLFAERADNPAAALRHYTAAVEADGRRFEACCNALAFLLARDDAASLDAAGQLIQRVPANVRASTPQLLINEAIYLQKSGRPAEARQSLERVLAGTGGRGELAQVARQLLDELDAPS